MPEPAYADIVRRHARRWEAMARHRSGMTLDEHRNGESQVDPEEFELLGDLSGKRVLHLACSVCDEGITMALRGASVVGVDISPTHIRVGREKAAALGVDVDLRIGDMMRLDDDLRGFDVVYISSGGICWVPDLDDWLAGIRRALRHGGVILIADHHPLWETLGVVGDRTLTVLRDYFGTDDLPPIADATKSAVGTAETADHSDGLHPFVWGIGELVTASIRNGFRIAALQEFPLTDLYPGLGEAAGYIPAAYRLMAEAD